MILTINDNVLIDDLKDHFTKCYPGLKIEFYRIHIYGAMAPLRKKSQ
jgi:hypothetical protein